MNNQISRFCAVAGAIAATAVGIGVHANAQRFVAPGTAGAPFGRAYSFSAPLTVSSYGGYYGGYYGNSDPTITVTPFGIESLGYGYNGYTGSGQQYSPDWEILREVYAQAYQDAQNSAAANAPSEDMQVTYPNGTTTMPRSALAARRVAHGTDTVRMWRVGRGAVALRWQGDPRTVSSVTFALTDKAGNPIRRTTLDQLPAEIHFTPPANAVYYQAKVRYIDGATNIIMGKLLR